MLKPYQIFIGCPFTKGIRSSYDRLKREVEAETPLSLVLADTVGISSSNYLLDSITTLIRESASCIFDATGGNPNVSLEVGIAHTQPVDFLLTIRTRKDATTAEKREAGNPASREVRSIISDLQGKNRIEYKEYGGLRKQLNQRYFAHLPIMKRWHEFSQKNKEMIPYALMLYEDLRTSGRSQTARLAKHVYGTGFSAGQVLKALGEQKLVSVKPGRMGGIFYPSK